MFHLCSIFPVFFWKASNLPFNCSSLSVVSKGVGLFSTSNVSKSDYANNGALSPLTFQIYQSISFSASGVIFPFNLLLSSDNFRQMVHFPFSFSNLILVQVMRSPSLQLPKSYSGVHILYESNWFISHSDFHVLFWV